MRKSITAILTIYQRIGKDIFPLRKCNCEHNGNSVHTTKSLALGEALNIHMHYLMFYQGR